MILVALGSNQSGPWGTPEQTVKRAMLELNSGPIKLKIASSLIQTAPFGIINQPSFVNAVACIETALSPHALLRRLHMIERTAGRRRGRRWGPRTLDLDLIDYNSQQITQKGLLQKALVLPHPGIALRLFVLEPIAEIAPRWKHPVNHKTAVSMIQKL
jgi:2-amino-4-hydroxy-6-hydroxymethyldihydropteridine diphosphokinase